MPPGFRDRIKQAIDEANAKAETMTEAEINARLGPATRTLFAASERMEGSMERAMANAGKAFFVVLAFLIGGYFFGRHMGDDTTLAIGTDVAKFLALTVVAFGLVGAARRSGADAGYLAGFLGMLAASAGSGGNLEAITVAFGLVVGSSIAALVVRLPKVPAQ